MGRRRGSGVSSVPVKGERNWSVRALGVHSTAPHNPLEMPVPGNGNSSLLPAPHFQQRLPRAASVNGGGERREK